MNDEIIQKIYDEIINIKLELLEIKKERFEDKILDGLGTNNEYDYNKNEILGKLEEVRRDIIGIYSEYQSNTNLNEIKEELNLIGTTVSDIYAKANFDDF